MGVFIRQEVKPVREIDVLEAEKEELRDFDKEYIVMVQ